MHNLKIKYSNELFKTKLRLEKEKQMIDMEIYRVQSSCSHLPVLLDYNDIKEYTCCLLCGMKNVSIDNKLVIDASSLMIPVNKREETYKMIQNLYLRLSSNNLDLTLEELVDKTNNEIKVKRKD